VLQLSKASAKKSIYYQ